VQLLLITPTLDIYYYTVHLYIHNDYHFTSLNTYPCLAYCDCLHNVVIVITVEISASPFIESLLMYMDIVIQQSAGSTYANPHTTRHISLATSTFSTTSGASLNTINKVTTTANQCIYNSNNVRDVLIGVHNIDMYYQLLD
jgi:hypothetical protein